MSEEEKKAIDLLKEYEEDELFRITIREALQTILNLIEKQEKQIEEYKSGEVFTAKQMHYIDDNYIDKDKIRDKIKELEEYQKQHKEENWADIPIEDYDFDKINLLKELLED